MNCQHCQAPLIRLNSQNVKICVDNPFTHVFENKLKEGQKALIKAER